MGRGEGAGEGTDEGAGEGTDEGAGVGRTKGSKVGAPGKGVGAYDGGCCRVMITWPLPVCTPWLFCKMLLALLMQ